MVGTTTYKGLTIMDATPSHDGGLLIQNNFIQLADWRESDTTNGSFETLVVQPSIDGLTTVQFADAASNNILVIDTTNREVEVSGTSYFGDGGTTNYLEIKDDGELLLHGTARVTSAIKVFTAAELQRGTSPPASGSLLNYSYEQYTINDDSLLNLAILDTRAAGTDIIVAIRWAIDEAYATNNAEIQWQIDWSVCPDDGSEALDSPTRYGTVKSGDINIPATPKTIIETQLTIPGSTILDTDELGFVLKRVAIDDGNNPDVEPGVIIVGVLVIRDRIGATI